MHYHTSFGKFLGALVLILISFAAIIIGLIPFGINFFETTYMRTNLAVLVMPLQIAIGIAGVLALIHLITKSADHCTYCRKCASCEMPHTHK